MTFGVAYAMLISLDVTWLEYIEWAADIKPRRRQFWYGK
jgi:hypothetical protein